MSIKTLEDELNQVEHAMEALSLQMNELTEKINSTIEYRHTVLRTFNSYDEKTVELKEAINTLKTTKGAHDGKKPIQ